MKNLKVNKAVKEKWMRAKARLQMTALLFCASITAGMSPVFADRIGDAANKAATGAQQSAVGLVKPLLILCAVVFGLMGIGGRRAKEEQKDGIWEKIAGGAIVVLAVPIGALVFGWIQ